MVDKKLPKPCDKNKNNCMVVKFLFQDVSGVNGKRPGDPYFLPGDKVAVLKTVNKDWCYVEKFTTGFRGYIPSSYLHPLKKEEDDIEKNLAQTLAELNKEFQHYYVNTLRPDENNFLLEFQESWESLAKFHLGRPKLLNKVSTKDKSLLNDQVLLKTYDFPANWRDSAVLNEHGQLIDAYNLNFFDLLKIYETPDQLRNLPEEDKGSLYHCLNFAGSEVKLHFPEGNVNMHLALFREAEGFVSEFYTYSRFQLAAGHNLFAKKKVIFPTTEDGHLVVLIVVEDIVSKCNKCYAFGHIRIQDLDESKKSNYIYIHPYKDQAVSLREYIKRHLEFGHKDNKHEDHAMIFKYKKIKQSMIENDDYVMRKNDPVHISEHTNRLYVTILKGKISENFSVFGDTGDMGIEAYVFMKDGTYLPSAIDLAGSVTGHYTTNSLSQTDWTETFIVHIPEYWKECHFVFKIYKYEEKKKGKLVAFAFLPLINTDSEGNETILRDDIRKLVVYGLSGGKEPDADDYLPLEYMISDQIVEKTKEKSNKRDSAKRRISNKGKKKKDLYKGAKFERKKDDFLEVQTKLRSTQLTEDVAISQLMNVDLNQVDEADIEMILENFVTFREQDSNKKLLFLPTLLDKLWLILKTYPTQASWVFLCFFEATYRLAITSKGEFEDLRQTLYDYLETRFASQEFYTLMSAEMINFLAGNERSRINEIVQTLTKPPTIFIIKSFQIFLEFTERSYMKYKSDENGTIFLQLTQQIVQYLQRSESDLSMDKKMKTNQGYLYQELEKTSCLKILKTMMDEQQFANLIIQFMSLERLMEKGINLIMDMAMSIFNPSELIPKQQWPKIFKGIVELLKEGKANGKTKIIEKVNEVLKLAIQYCLNNDLRTYKEELTYIFMKYITDQRIDPIGKIEDEKEELICTIFLSMLDDVQMQTIGDFEDSTLLKVLEKIQIIITLNRYQIITIRSLKIKMFCIIESFLAKLSVQMLNRPKNTKLYAQYVLTVTSVLKDDDFQSSKLNKNKQDQTLENTKFAMLEKLEAFVGKLDDPVKLELAKHGGRQNEDLIDNILNTSLLPCDSLQQSLIRIVTDFFMAEFNVSPKQTMYEMYGRVIGTLIKYYPNKSLPIEGEALKSAYVAKYRKAVDDFFLTKNINCSIDPKDAKKDFCYKYEKVIDTLGKILNVIVDTSNIRQFYTKSKSSDPNKGPGFDSLEPENYYFALVTAEYRLYETLKEIEEMAKQNGLMETNNKETGQLSILFDTYKEILFYLYKKFDSRGNYLNCAFTLQEFESLLPWCTKKIEHNKDAQQKIIEWWYGEMKKDPSLKEKFKKSIKALENKDDIENDMDKLVMNPNSLNITWTEYKEIVQKLAIIKFDQACGYEASIELMEALVNRYKTVDIDFHKLSVVLHNLADIYEAQADFKTLMSEVSSAKKHEREVQRRDIMLPEYFKIDFVHAKNVFSFLHGKKFICREKGYSKSDDLMENLLKWFPGAHVVFNKAALKNFQALTKEYSVIIFLQKVTPAMTNMECFERLVIPFQVLQYKTRNVTNLFVYTDQINKQEDVKVQLNICSFELPGILSWTEIITDQVSYIAPAIVSHLTNLQQKNMELQSFLERLQVDINSVSMTLLCQSIQGVILAAVNGGIPALKSRFINAKYQEENPSHVKYVRELENEIYRQNVYLEGLLKIHGEQNKQMEGLQQEMEKEFEIRKRESLGNGDLTFKVPALDRQSIMEAKNNNYKTCFH